MTVVEPDTNIVIAELAAPLDVDAVLEALKARGVWMVGFGPGGSERSATSTWTTRGSSAPIAAFRAASRGAVATGPRR